MHVPFAYRYARKLDVHNQVIRNVIQYSQSCHGIRGVVILLFNGSSPAFRLCLIQIIGKGHGHMENPTFQKETPQISDSKELPLWQKYTLTVEEASRYFRIGQAKLRRLINENEDAVFILWNGNRPQIKRKLFEEFVDQLNAI